MNAKDSVTVQPGSCVRSGRLLPAALLVAAVSLLVFLPGLDCGFINVDDPAYVLNNEALRGLDVNLLRWAFSPPAIDLWIPLTWISLAMDYRIWGLDPYGYHLTNILLHAGNSALVVFLAGRLAGMTRADRSYLPFWLAVCAGLFFAVHPLRVESVVWITERKDVLNAFFALSAICCYCVYAGAMGNGQRSRHYYWLSLLLMLLSLLAKPITVVLPLLLLLLDFFPLRRWESTGVARLLREKVPFALIALIFAVITLLAGQRNQLLAGGENITAIQRLAVSGNAIFEYVRMLVWPSGIIPHFIIPSPVPAAYFVKSVAVAIFCIVIFISARKRPGVAVTWLLFLTPLLPVLAIFQNGTQGYAARYTYLPSAVVCITTSVLLTESFSNLTAGVRQTVIKLAVPAMAASLLLYGAITRQQIAFWTDSAAYWSRVIALQPYDMAYFGRALHYMESGDYRRAIGDFTRSIEMASVGHRNGLDNIYAYRGEAYLKQGEPIAAVADYSRAISLSPRKEYLIMLDTAQKMVAASNAHQGR